MLPRLVSTTLPLRDRILSFQPYSKQIRQIAPPTSVPHSGPQLASLYRPFSAVKHDKLHRFFLSTFAIAKHWGADCGLASLIELEAG